MRAPQARGISLWLMPEGETRERLAALIQRLAARLGTVTFAPHVTLLPGLTESEGGVLQATEALAADIAPFPIDLDALEGRDEPFRCLFVRAAATEALRQAHAVAARRLGRSPDAVFSPHLSLVYGVLSRGTKTALTRELAAEVPVAFEAHRIHVWRTEGPVGDWRELAVVPFASPGSSSTTP
jgi:2'-5' RNA ligase